VRVTVDERALQNPSEFFDEAYPRVFRFLASLTGAPTSDVDDLTQDALLEAWRGRAAFRGESSLLTWVLGIARRRALSLARSSARRGEILRALRSLELAPLPEDVLRDAETVALVRAALDAIEPSYAQALLLRYFDGLSTREIAAALGESEKAVESRLHRAREALRARLKEEP
jgi:RNA polymerase sigma-70 factor (ECF subfamily)